ncbi:MAG TPA: phospholipase D-like domain-containing protein [Clostridia bacterium]|nr:phospholipase D-like domain-containing protein [Clostridia bacterium]
MRLLAEEEYKQMFEYVKPYCLVAPFGLNWDYIPTFKTLVITSKNYIKCFEHKNYEVRTYENCHAKLAIGSEGTLVGSWNWSLAHSKATKNREIVIFVEVNEPVFEQLQDWFDYTWNKARPVVLEKTITKLQDVL